MKKYLMLILVFTFVMVLSLKPINGAGWGFSKNNQHLIPDVGWYSKEIEGTDSFFVGNNDKSLYLTFDLGYDEGTLEQIIEILNKYDVPSTFFVTGDLIKREPDKIKMIVDNGYTVGNHTYSHKNITKLSFDGLKEEIEKVEDLYYQLTNKQMINYFRPPEGEFDNASLMNVKKLGYKTFFWSIAYYDWNTKNQKGVDYTYNSVIDNLHNGAIILMHTVSQDNVKALPSIIEQSINQGYQFKDLSEINYS